MSLNRTVCSSTLTYYLLNETVTHGTDIAHAVRHPWRIEPAHAAMVLARFIVPIVQAHDLGYSSTARRQLASGQPMMSASEAGTPLFRLLQRVARDRRTVIT
jgi:hypothetical protein